MELTDERRRVVYGTTKDGAFVVGDCVTRRTVYAYPTSSTAYLAGKDSDTALHIALSLVHEVNRMGTDRDQGRGAEYDARNWELLGSDQIL